MQDTLQPGQFTGFIPSLPTPTDFVASGETGVLDQTRNDFADWRKFLPTNEGQMIKSNGVAIVDSNACVSFSANNTCETLVDLMITYGQMPLDALNFLKSYGYLDENGKFNASDRFTAKMSGTDPHVGNTLQAVWDSIRHNGMVPESMWPMPQAEIDAKVATGHYTNEDIWNIYYSAVPADVVAMGKLFVQWFDAQYEWIAWPGSNTTMDQFAHYLKVSPLQIATAVCNGWNNDNPINACGAGSQHATMMAYVEEGVAYDIYDHYNPFLKRFAADYDITYAMRGVLTAKVQAPIKPAPFTHNYLKNLTLGAPASSEVTAMQKGLQTLGYMKVGVVGPFGPQTQVALAKFQVDNKIPNSPQGHDFGPKSRAALTAALQSNAQKLSGAPLPAATETVDDGQ